MIIKKIKEMFISCNNDLFPEVIISKKANVNLLSRNDHIGKKTKIDAYSVISSSYGGTIRIGERCEIGYGTLILTYGGDIIIGNECSFNPYCVIYGHGGLEIGNYVRIATHTIIIPSNHKFELKNIPIHKQGISKLGIKIEDDVWIGAGVKILDGVKIGEGSIIGAGAVVTNNVEPYSIYAGVPAQKIKNR